MALKLYLRKTEDWDNVTYETLSYRNFWTNRHWKIQTLWDKRSYIPWIELRKSLKNLSLSQWPLPYETEETLDLKDDDLLIPTDDDDWIHPEIAQIVDVMADLDYLSWNAYVNQMVFNYNIHRWHPVHQNIGTNCYCLRGSFLKGLSRKDFATLMHNHSDSVTIAASLGARVGKIPDILSVYNWHPGSISAIGAAESHQDISKLFPTDEPDIKKAQGLWFEEYYLRILKLIGGCYPRLTLL